MPRFFDAHCHLQDAKLLASLPHILERARRVKVSRFLCCGIKPSDWAIVRQLTQQHPEIIPSLGLHPWYLAERGDHWLDDLERLLLAGPAGVGEMGLDHALAGRSDAEQEEVLLVQLRLAKRLRRPISLHCRKAWGRLLALLADEGGAPDGGIIHSYSGPANLVGPLEQMGFYLSFSGAITCPNNKQGPRALVAVSAERLLIESDSPDMLPTGLTSTINEPANLPLIAATVARLRNVSTAALAEQTYINAERLLRPLL